ncbi:hypothetical protein HNR42_001049 [Deinobacterium chartae]|uniref:Uncharacterized protein n=1 Tax=Deinobacterium chartae TaxID=521158 RepID=A0A841I0J3_9DEIO|nr:hypothetical protein [Deinobacterium chartae]MBB6097632.1 hypothetical protein [Deinobacterium chartae]
MKKMSTLVIWVLTGASLAQQAVVRFDSSINTVLLGEASYRIAEIMQSPVRQFQNLATPPTRQQVQAACSASARLLEGSVMTGEVNLNIWGSVFGSKQGILETSGTATFPGQPKAVAFDCAAYWTGSLFFAAAFRTP